MEAAQPICIAFNNADVSKSEVLISSNAIGVTGGNGGIITIPRFAGDWGVYRIVFFDKGLSVNAIVWFWVNSKRALIYLYSTSSGSDAYLKYKVDGRCSVLVVANNSGGSASCFIVGVNASRACSITWLVNTNPNVKVTCENNIVTISGISTWFSASMISTRNIEIMK